MRRLIILLFAIGLLALPATAAADSSCQAYSPQTAGTSTTVCTNTSATHVVRSAGAASGTLPFTGLDLPLLLVGSAGLIGAGVAVRRLSTHGS